VWEKDGARAQAAARQMKLPPYLIGDVVPLTNADAAKLSRFYQGMGNREVAAFFADNKYQENLIKRIAVTNAKARGTSATKDFSSLIKEEYSRVQKSFAGKEDHHQITRGLINEFIVDPKTGKFKADALEKAYVNTESERIRVSTGKPVPFKINRGTAEYSARQASRFGGGRWTSIDPQAREFIGQQNLMGMNRNPYSPLNPMNYSMPSHGKKAFLGMPLPKLPENSLVAENNYPFTPIIFEESDTSYEVAENTLSSESDLAFDAIETANREPASIKPHQTSKEEIDFLNWLLRVGELSYAQKLLISKVSSKKPTLSEKELTILIRGAESGVYFPLFSKFSNLDPEKKKNFFQEKLPLIFPRPYLKEVKQWSLSSNVEPEFMYSIMRQESAFNPRARSGADAFGLLQIIPVLADKYHDDVISEFDFHPKNLKAKKFLRKTSHEKLLEPDFNIAIGSRVIRSLKDRYQGKFIPMVCAYNASEKAVNNWIQNWTKANPKKDILEFIEEVPYEETRIYIKLTMRNYLFYKRFSQKQGKSGICNFCEVKLLSSALK
jgi:hypothetical protein